jgi:hypothetical protein
MGVGIDDGAHLNAPSSLNGPAAALGGTLRAPESARIDR